MEIRSATDNASQFEPGVMTGDEQSTIKQRLGRIGRRIKQIDLREKIIAHPFAAIGIGAAVGAAIGLARPKPQPSRVTSAIVATLGALAFRLVREAALKELGGFAKQMMMSRRERSEDTAVGTQQPVAGSETRYTPPY